MPQWSKISSSYLVPTPNYWTWARTTPQKKQYFWSNPYKMEIMITSLIEMLELPNHGSHDHIHNIIWINFVGHVMDRSYDVIAFISKYLYFRKAWGSHFCWHHKIVTFFIKTIFKDSIKVKRTKNFVSKCNLYMFFF